MKSRRPVDSFLIVLVGLLVLFGLAILASASSEIGKIKYNDSYYFLKHQLLYGATLGALGFCAGLFIPYAWYRKVSFILLAGTIALISLVFTPLGIRAGGATRWLGFGSFSFQPAELLKITFILYVAAWFAGKTRGRGSIVSNGLAPFLIVSAVTAGILLLQPATSTVVILLIAGFAIHWISGASTKSIIGIALVMVAVLSIVIIATPYRLVRIKSYLNPTSDSQNTNYHRTQALIAIGSGQLTGEGYGRSTAKVNRIPAVIDDSIFAVAAQELGFLGSLGLLSLFGALVFRLFTLAFHMRDTFGRGILIGFGTIIAFQSIVNIGAISGLLPITGVPLPFVSYGGTAFAVFLTMMGISLNVSRNA